jgi:hypothetical protein
VFLKLAILRSFRTRVDDGSGLLIGTEMVGEDAMKKKKKKSMAQGSLYQIC